MIVISYFILAAATLVSAHVMPRTDELASRDITGGYATFYSQNGLPGACGEVHSDWDHICALDVARYGNPGTVSSFCGQSVSITNNNNGHSVTAVIADVCVTCPNGNSLDLSLGAFEAIASLSDGIVPITWDFI